MDRSPAVLVAATPPASWAAVPLSDVLWPPPEGRWAGRYGLRRLRLLGDWLRALHGSRPAVDPAPRHSGVDDGVARTDLDVVRERLTGASTPLTAAGAADLPRAHVTSLRQWADLLADGPRADHPVTTHGQLGLEQVGWVDGSGGDLVVRAPVGIGSTRPATDVGWVTGDLLRWVHQARSGGADPSVFERLLAAFLTGYHGLGGGTARGDLDVHRAAAVRVASRSLDAVDPTVAALDRQLTRVLVEHCWSAAGREG